MRISFSGTTKHGASYCQFCCEVYCGKLSFECLVLSISQQSPSEEPRKSCTAGVANMILSLLSSAWFPLDLSAHQDALILAGNLLAGGYTIWKSGTGKFSLQRPVTRVKV